MSNIHWRKNYSIFSVFVSCPHLPSDELFPHSHMSEFCKTFPSKGPGWNSRDMASKGNSVKSTLRHVLKITSLNQSKDNTWNLFAIPRLISRANSKQIRVVVCAPYGGLWSLSLIYWEEGHELVFTRRGPVLSALLDLSDGLDSMATQEPPLIIDKDVLKPKHTHTTTEIHCSFGSLLERILCSIRPFVWDTEIPEHKNVGRQLELLVKLQSGNLGLLQIGLIKPY